MTVKNKIYSVCDMGAPEREVFAFHTTRHGGYSSGNYGQMNCTHYCGDETESVMRNRRLLLETLPCRIDRLVIPHQTHGNEVLVADKDFLSSGEKKQTEALYGIDALITSCRNVCLCVSTADCVPLLLYSPSGVVAAVHAGWRGTVSKIVCRTLEVIERDFGCRMSEVKAFIGPSISVAAFEVGDEVCDEFSIAGFDMDSVSFRNEETGKFHIDLWEANRSLMVLSGMDRNNIYCSGVCTWSNYEDVFSARRLGINSGRILSGIVLI